MAARWYLCPVIGTGVVTDPYRPKVPSRATIPNNAAGAPLFPWSLVWVKDAQTAQANADTTFFGLPAIALDSPISTALTGAQVTALLNKLTSLSVSTAGITGASTLRAVLVRAGTTLISSFDPTRPPLTE